MSPHNQTKTGEMRRSRFGYALSVMANMPRLRRRALLLAFRLEGGQFFSYTARDIMRRHYGVDIGAYSYGGCFEPGTFQQGVSIGRYASIGPSVLVYRRDHPLDWLSTHPFFYNSALGYVDKDPIQFQPLEIGHDAWIGARTFITPKCSRIGIGSVVGAGSILTRDVPDFAIVGGAPARIIKMRFPEETCKIIRSSVWWSLPINQCVLFLKEMMLPIPPEPLKHPLLSCVGSIGRG